MPTYYYFNPVLAGDLSLNVQVMTARLRQVLFLVAGGQPLADRGLVFVQALNCRGEGAAGIALRADTADELTQVSDPAGGSANGHGIFHNLPAGTATLSAEVLTTGRTFGTTAVHVRPDALTHVRLAPTGK